jgi:hypothetical protein
MPPIEEAGGVGGHVGDQVGDRGRRVEEQRAHVGDPGVVEPGGAALIAVVEGDHVEAGVDHGVDERRREVGHLCTQSVDGEQRGR